MICNFFEIYTNFESENHERMPVLMERSAKYVCPDVVNIARIFIQHTKVSFVRKRLVLLISGYIFLNKQYASTIGNLAEKAIWADKKYNNTSN